MAPIETPTTATPVLRPVDEFAVTFLVDNCLEWMTKLPPGFKHELPQHLFDQHPPNDAITGVPVLDFNNYCCGAHGFSALIETQIKDSKRHLTLFDTGPDLESIVRNARSMQVPLASIDRVILSHWHSDHTGGLLSFLRKRGTATPPCVVDAHPNRPLARGIASSPTYETVIGQLARDPTFAQIEEAGGEVEKHAEGHVVADGTVWVSGEIPRETAFEGGLPGGMRWVSESESGGESESAAEGQWIHEPHIMDERYAAIDVFGKGLIIFSACSHAGIVNVVKDAVERLSRPVYMIVGGLHLAGTDLVPRIPHTVNFLSKQLRPAPTYILPMHCSGFQAKVALEAEFGEGCVPAGVGMKVEVLGDREADKRLSPAVFASS
ncbi:beta-lactamase-like protein [Hygrophoropsis aurantiaca]|uniref:Beta-lactamase-like protein n=1 Tax=Hygrophoropsis aurantiaca TaxID=72124 RepID=A0ACB7ZY30_9AGAM|nr:beta-lactamase-like protein [Hygrophoropsis aurantiaca]